MKQPMCSMVISKVSTFIKKYFLEGQKLEEKQKQALEALPSDAPFTTRILVKHRRLIGKLGKWFKCHLLSNKHISGILIPLVFFEILWWMQAFKHDYFSYFPDRYLLSITMIFGASIAGMTSEGGGAVAFPVMTLALGIKPAVARDFSLMIQSCGIYCF